MNSLLSKMQLDVPNQSFADLFLERTESFGDRPALTDGLSGEQLTYAELSRHVRVVAGNLIDRGLEPGEVTALIVPNNIWYPVALYGIAFAGGVFSTLNPMSSPEDVYELLKLIEATRVIVTPQIYERLRDVLNKLSLKEIFVLGESEGLTPFATLLDGKPIAEERTRDLHKDILALMFSSGTSGFPKAVMLSNQNYVSAIEQINSGEITQPFDTILAALPFFHIYGQISFIGSALSKGARLIVLPAFDLETTLRVIQDYKVAVAPVVAPIVLLFAKHPLVGHFDLSNLRVVVSGCIACERGNAEEGRRPAASARGQRLGPHRSYDNWRRFGPEYARGSPGFGGATNAGHRITGCRNRWYQRGASRCGRRASDARPECDVGVLQESVGNSRDDRC